MSRFTQLLERLYASPRYCRALTVGDWQWRSWARRRVVARVFILLRRARAS